jgi:hypothetical protein
MQSFLGIAIPTLIVLAGLTWWIPRRIGIAGIFIAHVLVFFGFIFLEALAINRVVIYEPELTLLVIAMAVAFNAVLLPVAIVAVWRQARCARPDPSPARLADIDDIDFNIR